MHPINVCILDKSIADLLPPQTYKRLRRYLDIVTKNPSKFAYKRVFGRQDHDYRQSIDEVATQNCSYLLVRFEEVGLIE